MQAACNTRAAAAQRPCSPPAGIVPPFSACHCQHCCCLAYPCLLLSPSHRPFYPAGKVYRGRWKGAIVAVKVIDHRVQPGKTYDLSREPLLSMSVSHPNVVITHKVSMRGRAVVLR